MIGTAVLFVTTAIMLVLLAVASFVHGRTKAIAIAQGDLSVLHSRPAYHGLYSALWVFIVGFGLFLATYATSSLLINHQLEQTLPQDAQSLSEIRKERLFEDAKALAKGEIVSLARDERSGQIRAMLAEQISTWWSWRAWVVAMISVLSGALAFSITQSQLTKRFRARNHSERIIRITLLGCAVIAILTTIGIVLSLIGETLRFFSEIPVTKFLFGTHWSPLSGVYEGRIDENSVGAIPLFAGTMMITLVAMFVAIPIGLMSAIYLSDYAGRRVRVWVKPLLEILAGIPTVVYGFFAAITVAPFVRNTGESIGLSVASESALAAGIVMGVMIIPFISSLSDDVINAVPQDLRDGSYGLGATKAETITKVVLPGALPGIVSAILLGMSRAIGETMIVVMAAGQGANLTWNPLEAVTTVTVQIVALITGDTEAATAAGPAFALGFTLFCITLIFNVLALRMVHKYRQKYD